MHRANSGGGGDGPHVSSKVRVIKLSGGQGGESDGFSHTEGQPQRLPQPPDMRQQPTRKVTLTKGVPQQPQHLPVGPTCTRLFLQGLKASKGFTQPRRPSCMDEDEEWQVPWAGDD